MGLAYKVRMPDGTLRFGLLNGAYLLYDQEEYAQYKARFEEQYEDDVNAKHPWCEKTVDLTSKVWSDYLTTPFMGDFPVCSQEPSYPSHPTDSDNVDPFRASYDQRAIGDLRSQ
ncbi:hypothetical protein UCRNP2_2073 [Neofusicoccum parvum UCRNP2]|uniref:Uncharacterized protein n=1 Tax=Botryosphaeria parva (strain UCR-NP2) TaxID=1287680 RepID=R1ETM1_BOTPV|nr:hypothetical protein UCRNP2_2073 [Neofusicoccum parvum UCRNP2]